MNAYFPKPPLLDDLTAALRTAAERALTGRSSPRSLFWTRTGTASPGIVTLLLNLGAHRGIERDDLARLLVKSASTRELTFFEFIAVANALHFLFSKSDLPLSVALSEIRVWIEDASERTPSPIDVQFAQLVSRIEIAGKSWSKISEKGIAAELQIDPIWLRNIVTEEYGVTFVRCRRAIVMRRAAFELLNGNEHVRQIAFRLGYTDAGNIDHDFRAFFGVTPTAFRRLQ